MLAFAAGIGIFTAACFGLAPALLQSPVDLQETLREAARGTAGGARWARNLLVVGQVALAVMLLSGAGLLVRSVGELLNEDTGVTVRTALTTDIQLSDVDYDALARGRATFYRPCCWRALAWHSPGPAQASRQPRSEHVCWVGCSTASGRQIPFPSVRHSPWCSPLRSRRAFCRPSRGQDGTDANLPLRRLRRRVSRAGGRAPDRSGALRNADAKGPCRSHSRSVYGRRNECERGPGRVDRAAQPDSGDRTR